MMPMWVVIPLSVMLFAFAVIVLAGSIAVIARSIYAITQSVDGGADEFVITLAISVAIIALAALLGYGAMVMGGTVYDGFVGRLLG